MLFVLHLQGLENSLCILRNLSYQLYTELPLSVQLRLEGPARSSASQEIEPIGCFTLYNRKSKEVKSNRIYWDIVCYSPWVCFLSVFIPRDSDITLPITCFRQRQARVWKTKKKNSGNWRVCWITSKRFCNVWTVNSEHTGAKSWISYFLHSFVSAGITVDIVPYTVFRSRPLDSLWTLGRFLPLPLGTAVCVCVQVI